MIGTERLRVHRMVRMVRSAVGALLLCVAATTLPSGDARALVINQTLFASPGGSATLNTGGGAFVIFANFSDSDTSTSVSRGNFLGFNGFDSSLGTLNQVTWNFSGFHRVVSSASTACVTVLGLFCQTSSTTTTGYSVFGEILDGVPSTFEFQSAVNNVRVTTVAGSILGCLTLSDCDNSTSTTRTFNETVIRTGSDLLGYTDVPLVQLEVGRILTVRNDVACTIAIALAAQCFAEGQGSASSQVTVTLTYDFTAPPPPPPPQPSPVPTPATSLMLLAGLAGLGGLGRWQRKQAFAKRT